MNDTGKQIAPMETFIERVKGKLRDDIGSMLPDDVVAEMVKRVIDDEFFKPRIVAKPGRASYSTDTIEKPTAFQDAVLSSCKPIIEKHVLRVMAEHAEKIEKQISETVERGLLNLAIQQIDSMFQRALNNHAWTIKESIESEMRNKGLM